MEKWSSEMEIIVARTAGFCFGVKRALEMVQAALDDQVTPIYSLGPLIHNPQVVQDLEAKGLKVVDSVDAAPEGRLVIRSHGVGPDAYLQAKIKNLAVIDATCPFVKNVQQLAGLLHDQEYQVVIFGEQEHAEVRGVLDSVCGDAVVVSAAADLKPGRLGAKIGVISQTTQEISGFKELVEALIPIAKEVRVYNTICLATSKRQAEAASLSRMVELMIVVGGKNSANTSRLAEICRSNGTVTLQVESPTELRAGSFHGVKQVGVTAGASTPEEQILAVIEGINKLGGS